MKLVDAKKLHNEDEVLIRESRTEFRPAFVVETIVEDKDVFIRCDDGHLYHHTALK